MKGDTKGERTLKVSKGKLKGACVMAKKNETPVEATQLIAELYGIYGAQKPEVLQYDIQDDGKNKKANELKLKLFKMLVGNDFLMGVHSEVGFYLKLSDVIKQYLKGGVR